MKRLLRFVSAILFSRATPPLVIGFFLLVYVGIAFITDETLIALMQFTRTSLFLTALLALLPLNSAVRIVAEAVAHLKRRRALTGSSADVSPGLFDETVELKGSSSFDQLQGRLEAVGYKTRQSTGTLGAWRGINNFSARILFIAGVFCLFGGILVSLSSRTSKRVAVVEGEQFSSSSGEGGMVERISLERASGLILAKELSIEVAPSSGSSKKTFGIYPPSLFQGAFVYPRYLGIGLLIRLSAPDLPAGYEKFSILDIYRPGKEDTTEMPGSPYRVVFSLVGSDDGTDPYATGRMSFNFKLLKGKDVVLTGNAPGGGEFIQDGYRIALPQAKRLVITDFVHDYGVFLIWTATLLFVAAGLIWLPVRVFFPRGEMLFRTEGDAIHAFSRAEGTGRRHNGAFHEALDLLESKKTGKILGETGP